jgi:hypothetical protein
MKAQAPEVAAATTCASAKWVLAISVTTFLFIVAAPADAEQRHAQGLNRAEKCVLEQAGAGEVAHLSKQFPDEKDRKLSARFLENLLTSALPDLKLHRHGVRIVGAIIDEPLDFENAQIPCEVWLEHCQFNASTNFNGATFAGTISFENSAFKADAGFNSIKAGRAVFNGAVFEGPVDFVAAEITTVFEAQGAKFQNKQKPAMFNSVKAGRAVFSGAVFEGPADFVAAEITRSFEAQGAKFQNKENEASFSGMKFRGDAILDGVVFEGPVNFGSADITSKLEAQGAMFRNSEKVANFSSIKVKGDALLNDAVFQGLCRAWQKAALLARNGKLSVDAAREVIAQGVADVFTHANVESLPSASIKSWCETWTEAKAIETEESTHTRYKRVIERFAGFLGEAKSKRDLSTLQATDVHDFVIVRRKNSRARRQTWA